VRRGGACGGGGGVLIGLVNADMYTYLCVALCATMCVSLERTQHVVYAASFKHIASCTCVLLSVSETRTTGVHRCFQTPVCVYCIAMCLFVCVYLYRCISACVLMHMRT
jgi:hypothetical protein